MQHARGLLATRALICSLNKKHMTGKPETSFSLYLCHWPLIQIRNWAVDKHYLDEAVGMMLVVTLIAIDSVLCWQYVEKPSRHLGRRIVRHERGLV